MQIITNNAGKELKKHGDSAFPFLVSYERLSGYETGSFLWHWHPEIELTYIHKGEMLYKVNQNTFHLNKIGAGICRVHGGGFAGVIMCVLPIENAEEYVEYMAQYVGRENVYPMNIRSTGAVHVE